MKKIFDILCATATLLAVLSGCQGGKEQGTQKIVDLRYRANDSYELAATDAQSFTIQVASTDPWTVSSDHPDWCIISQEQGEGAPADSVKIGHAPATTVRIQYYDNPDLDDREDKITIQSDFWVGKVITVRQKGCAFLTIPDEDLSLDVVKAGGDYTIHIASNQNWSGAVTDGDWLAIADGATGNGDGTISVSAQENTMELRYGEVTVYDRHQKASAKIKFTQDGVQLVPALTEVRASYDQLSGEVEITSNTEWTVEKLSGDEDWFTLVNTSGKGNGKIQITFTQNDGDYLRMAEIAVKNKTENPEDFQTQKVIKLKQAYKIEPVRTIFTTDELTNWSGPNSDWPNAAVYTKDLGVTFAARSRIRRDVQFGTYTFRWSNFVDDAEAGAPQARLWFCFDESLEIKPYIRPGDKKVSYEFNAAGDGNKPSVSSFTDLEDWTQPIEFTIKFDPSGAEHCHVSFFVNGKAAGSFDSSATFMRTITWGASISLYIGVDTASGSSAKETKATAVCEWMDYTAPVNWDE